MQPCGQVSGIGKLRFRYHDLAWTLQAISRPQLGQTFFSIGCSRGTGSSSSSVVVVGSAHMMASLGLFLRVAEFNENFRVIFRSTGGDSYVHLEA